LLPVSTWEIAIEMSSEIVSSAGLVIGISIVLVHTPAIAHVASMLHIVVVLLSADLTLRDHGLVLIHNLLRLQLALLNQVAEKHRVGTITWIDFSCHDII